jgi:hypothetical protein
MLASLSAFSICFGSIVGFILGKKDCLWFDYFLILTNIIGVMFIVPFGLMLLFGRQ